MFIHGGYDGDNALHDAHIFDLCKFHTIIFSFPSLKLDRLYLCEFQIVNSYTKDTFLVSDILALPKNGPMTLFQ